MACFRCYKSGSDGASGENECKRNFKKLNRLILTLLSLGLFVADIVLDAWTAVELFRLGAYWSFTMLVVVLFGSAVLINIYSWLWYKYDKFTMMTNLEKVLGPWLGVLHCLTLGLYFRHLAAVSASFENIRFNKPELEEIISYRRYDLKILRLFESYTESAPQIVLMLTIALKKEGWILHVLTAVKILASMASITVSEVKYYRAIIVFMPEETKESSGWLQLLPYFLVKLILVASRLAALALFASVEPCFIFTHFICSWLVLFFVASCSKTHLMKCEGGKWLYRATLGVMWYFNWFCGGVKWKTSKMMWLYHVYMQLDIVFLCGWWYWRMSSDPPHFEISCVKVIIAATAVSGFYLVGVLCKAVYLCILHPESTEINSGEQTELCSDLTDTGRKDPTSVKKKKQRYGQIFGNVLKYTKYLLFCRQICSATCEPTETFELEASDSSRENMRLKELANSFYS
uniref:XK-related protein n=1 Tax=Fundulus heteroclitus TaxID=8078 RepID=A0A3Q2NU49_FUNHE